MGVHHTCTNTHTHIHAHAHTHTHTHTHTHSVYQPIKIGGKKINALLLLWCSSVCTTHAQTHSQTHNHTHTHTHKHIHTHTKCTPAHQDRRKERQCPSALGVYIRPHHTCTHTHTHKHNDTHTHIFSLSLSLSHTHTHTQNIYQPIKISRKKSNALMLLGQLVPKSRLLL